MFEALASLANRRPWRVLGLTLVGFVVAGILGGPVAGLLNSDNDSFSDTSSDSTLAVEAIEDATGRSASPEVIVLLDAGDTAAIAETRSILEGDDHVAAVAGGEGAPFTSRDGTQTFLAAYFTADADADEVTEHLREQLARVDGAIVGGPVPAFQEVNEHVESDLVKAELIAFPLLFLASLWVFRSAVAALLPLLVGGLTIVISLLLLRGINEGVDISIFALNLITGLGLGLSIDYSLFMVSRYREELERVGPGAEAIRRTVLTAGRTVLFSAITVAGAGLALLVFPLRFLYSMGIGVTLVSLVAAVVSLVVLPSLFAVLRHRVNAGALKRWKRAREAEARADQSGFWYRLSQFVMRRPISVALAGTIVLLALGAPFLGIKLTGVDATVLPEGSAAKHVDAVLRSSFAGADTSPILVAVEAPESAGPELTTYADQLGRLDHADQVAPPAYLGDDIWRIDVVPDDRALADTSRALVDDIRSHDSPARVLVGGESADHVDQLRAIRDGLPPAMLILAALTLVTLFLMTGSMILPIKALLMNVLTVSATFGLLVLIFQDGRLEDLLGYTSQGALESTQPVFLFAVAFGLSTDYAVFLLTRIKEARDAGAGERESVALGLQRTGRIVTAAALLFAIALGSFATSQIIFIKELGIGTALAVLIDATIVRAMLVPSLMALLGRWNWWAPAPLRRLHERIGLSEGDPIGAAAAR
jgi:uncharacterized membrane protein YdfJ with MMPL/SSD domain